MVSLPEARERIKIPDGTSAGLSGRTLTIKGPAGSLSRTIDYGRLEVQVEAGEILVRVDLPRREDKAAVGTFASHVRNLIRGSQKPWEYRLKTVFAHFPIKTQVKGNEFLIENFLGERSPRRARILAGVHVEAKQEFITVTGPDLERVSQTAANIESATKVRNRDTRVFQDGIYIIQKAA